MADMPTLQRIALCAVLLPHRAGIRRDGAGTENIQWIVQRLETLCQQTSVSHTGGEVESNHGDLVGFCRLFCQPGCAIHVVQFAAHPIRSVQ